MKLKNYPISLAPFPGEHISSIVERMRNEFGGISEKRFYSTFCGYKHMPSPYNPEMVSWFEDPDPETIIENHTDYPYRQIMFGEALYRKKIGSIVFGQNRETLRSTIIPHFNELFYCPVCASEDMDKHQRPYLHVLHQIEGIGCCPRHGVKLKSFRFRDFPGYAFRCLSSSVVDFKAEKADQVSVDILKNLEGIKNMSREVALEAYRNLILDKGAQYNLKNGFSAGLNIQKVYQDLLDFYGEDFLKEKGLWIAENKKINESYSWISSMLVKAYNEPAPIIGHLMLWNAYGFDREQIMEYGAVPENPIYCPICGQITLTISRQGNTGIFKCRKCGHQFTKWVWSD